MSPFLTSTLAASSSKPCIHSSMLYVTVGAQVAFIILWGCPGSLASVLFSTTASAVAQQPSCMVFTITSTCAILKVQLTEPVKLNLTSLEFPKGSPSLSGCHPKNKIASPVARTMASVIFSSRPSWNMSAINETLCAWEGGGLSPPLSPEVTLMWMQ